MVFIDSKDLCQPLNQNLTDNHPEKRYEKEYVMCKVGMYI